MSAKKAAKKVAGKKRGPKEKIPFKSYGLPPSDPDFSAGLHLRNLAVDPTQSDQLSMIFGPVIAGYAGNNGLKLAGVTAMLVLRDGTPEMFEELLIRIMAMKREYLKDPSEKHRNWQALKAFVDFQQEEGRKPTAKPELKAWMIARNDVYKNLPDRNDHAGWTRVWRGAMLHELADRVGKD